jgi:hypothetical protein
MHIALTILDVHIELIRIFWQEHSDDASNSASGIQIDSTRVLGGQKCGSKK